MSAAPRLSVESRLSSKSVSVSRKSTSLSSATGSAAHRASTTSGKEDDGGLIVTRGLQEILDKERGSRRRPQVPTATGASVGKSKLSTRRRSSGQAPNFVLCYLCGRQFGTASIDFHRPQCYMKLLIAWERGDPATRGPKPLDPKEHEKRMMTCAANVKATSGLAAGGGSLYTSCKGFGGVGRKPPSSDIEMYNQLQLDAFNEASLSPCPNCGRTFLPDRLQIHLRSCKQGKPLKPMRTAAIPATSPGVTPSMSACSALAATRYTGSTNTRGGGGVPGAKPSRSPFSQAIVNTTREKEDLEGTARQSRGRPRIISATNVVASGSLNRVSAAAEVVQSDIIEVMLDADEEDNHGSLVPADNEQHRPFVAAVHHDPNSLIPSAANRLPSRESSPVHLLSSSPSAPEEHANDNRSGGVGRPRPSQSRGCDHRSVSELGLHVTHVTTRSVETLKMMGVQQTEGDLGTDTPQTGVDHLNAATQNGFGGGAERERNSVKRIQLNNVSHFKSVSSKLKLRQQRTESQLVACTYHERTFASSRIQKHESCSIDQGKPSAERRSAAPPTHPSTTVAAPMPMKSTPAAWVVEKSASVVKAQFCAECGGKFSTTCQKFCTECGVKL
ncbi:hypothetical protein JKF63_02715 [Porcisia hertigi]|uniref:C2HC/C3H-type domain-containing protein n=1 Tax=Porcisia hertigi TaxID=2761500 RepID=A0A836IA04_9TRYP|nr:hypothetical protein JKF63_02715 [Porcisia hertigi]